MAKLQRQCTARTTRCN